MASTYSPTLATIQAIVSPPVGMCGASCLLAHQTTAASATSDTKAWMSAKRRFMAKTAGRDRGGP